MAKAKGRSSTPRSDRSKLGPNAKVLSACGALLLIVVTALVTPLGQKLIDAIWPRRETTLVVSSSWPMPGGEGLSCLTSMGVAGFGNAPDLVKLAERLTPSRDPLLQVVEQVKAAPWYKGELRINLTTPDDRPVYVTGVSVVIHERSTQNPSWGLEFNPGCGGGPPVRLFEVLLDRGSVLDRGVYGDTSGEIADPTFMPRTEPLGRTFIVSRSDPAELVFQVAACRGYYEWGVVIDYLAGDQARKTFVGTARDPLVMSAGWEGTRRHFAWIDWNANSVHVNDGPLPEPPTGAGSNRQMPWHAAEICR
ncbi:hypothetical protein [Catellatospora tritici]|uniref:hypothetical protein n=1 Tax=Catellatospora tritici TaxID=2851566 RepID=UPI001C2D8C0D|nr:hypothetical protein [Catellatospora tritici]MBV1849441.1 hypothetical protein [Catellatospora tritici]MBV1854013.1 hypothetical protein [Catellatospora tritici]